jgi:hypothetical protein
MIQVLLALAAAVVRWGNGTHPASEQSDCCLRTRLLPSEGLWRGGIAPSTPASPRRSYCYWQFGNRMELILVRQLNDEVDR